MAYPEQRAWAGITISFNQNAKAIQRILWRGEQTFLSKGMELTTLGPTQDTLLPHPLETTLLRCTFCKKAGCRCMGLSFSFLGTGDKKTWARGLLGMLMAILPTRLFLAEIFSLKGRRHPVKTIGGDRRLGCQQGQRCL